MTRLSLACALFLSTLASAAPQQPAAQPPGDELPDGPGRRILQASCTSCHDLEEVTKLRGYYTKADWRDVVKTMVEYGAELRKGDDEVLVEYLAEQLGKKQGLGPGGG